MACSFDTRQIEDCSGLLIYVEEGVDILVAAQLNDCRWLTAVLEVEVDMGQNLCCC